MKYIFLCHKSHFSSFEDYYYSLIHYFTTSELLLYTTSDQILDCIYNESFSASVFLFIYYIPACITFFDERIFLINTEQMTRPVMYEMVKDVLSKGFMVLDYSLSNLQILNAPTQTFFLPYYINPTEIVHFDKIYDVAHCGVTNTYRQNIIDQLLNRNINIHNIIGWNRARDEILMKHKILINVHYNQDYRVFEEIRCNRCILNKVIVISETSLMADEYILKDYIILCKYEEIAETVEYVLEHYEEIYEELYGGEEVIEKIRQHYDAYLQEFVWHCMGGSRDPPVVY